MVIPDGSRELAELGSISFTFPDNTKTVVYDLVLTVNGTAYKNKYELYCYPANDDVISLENIASLSEGDNQVFITNVFFKCKITSKSGQKSIIYAE